MSDITIDRGFKWYATKEPIIVLLLSALAVVSFVAVAGLSRIYHARQNAVANDFYARGAADLKAGRLETQHYLQEAVAANPNDADQSRITSDRQPRCSKGMLADQRKNEKSALTARGLRSLR